MEPPLSWWDPAIGELLAKIAFPAPHITSCCFRGGGWVGGGVGGAPTFLVDVCHQHCIYLMKHVSVDGLLPLNKIMVFTVLEVSRQAILLSVVVVSAHRFNVIKQP